MDEQKRYDEAKKRVEEIKGFYMHLVVFERRPDADAGHTC